MSLRSETISANAAIASVGKKYSLRLTNKSLQSGTFCVYQCLEDGQKSNECIQLAWLVSACHPGGYVTFNWTIDYSVHWSYQGNLEGGVTFNTGGFAKVDIAKGERMKFTYEEPAYRFDGKAANGAKGTIGVNIDDTVKNGECLVAISVANKPFAAVSAQPNSCVTFNPLPVYFVSFGHHEEGAMMHTDSMVNSLTLDYDALGVHHLSYTLNGYNEWEPDTVKRN